MKKQTWISIVICIVFLVVSSYLYLHSGQETDFSVLQESESSSDWESGSASSAPAQEETVSAECTVYICGAVKSPGVYSFPSGSRVCDAVEAAGGLSKKAAAGAVNQARILVDGEQITIPRKTAGSGSASSDPENSSNDSGLININQADLSQLMTLSGIGQAKAQLIITYREENGSFQTKEDIMKISGIKEGIYNQIKDSITV
jgi:competence protein ComEA